MQEEISLREIIETIWSGKVIIASITAVAMILVAVYSFFIVSPTYETTATVRINLEESNNQYARINSLATTTKNDVTLNVVLNQLELNPKQYSISSLRENVKIDVVKDSNVVRLSMKGSDPDMITKIVNSLAFQLGARTEITERAEKIVGYQSRLNDIENSIAILDREIQVIKNQLKETPEKLITKKTVADEPYLQSIVTEQQAGNARGAGALELTHEEINPVYTDLTSALATANISIGKLQEEEKALQGNIAKHEARISTLEQQINNDRLKLTNSERLLGGFSAVFVSPAIEPTQPIGPNKKLNIAIAAVVGGMLSVMIVFIRHYWRTSEAITTPIGKSQHL